MTLSRGTRVGPYEITAPIGAGGMGEVFQARDTRLNRDVAIKVLPAALARDKERVARFRREAQLLASLNHTNIASIHGLEEGPSSDPSQADLVGLVMELVEGEDLAERLRRGALPVDEAIDIAKQIADGLEEAHDRGIIHRDLKPANIKVTSDSRVKILDFGLAKALDDSPAAASDSHLSHSPTLSRHATESGMILGTAAYMSPEQARGKVVDRRTDIWAFGVVLYEMLTGTRAFKGDDVSETLAGVLKDSLDMSRLPADLPQPVRRLLRRCLEKDPKKRLSSIGDARLELTEIGEPSTDDPKIEATRPALRRRGVATAVILAALLLGALALLAFRPGSSVEGPGISTRFRYFLPEGRLGSGLVSARQLAVSPDGTMIAFATARQVYVRQLDQLDARSVATTSGPPVNPTFSPDGKSIAYFETAGPAGSKAFLRRVDLSGGTIVTLASFDRATLGALMGVSWSNQTILFAHLVFPTQTSSIEAIDESGALRTLASLPKGAGVAANPRLIDGGKRVMYTVWTPGGEAGRTEIRDLDGSGTTVLEGVQDARLLPTGHLVYLQGTSLVAVPFDERQGTTIGAPVPVVEGLEQANPYTAQAAFSGTGTIVFAPAEGEREAADYSLVWVDRQGKEEPLKTPPRRYKYPRLSPDGARLVVDQFGEGGDDLWIWTFASETLSRLTFGKDAEAYPQWMPDSRRVVYRLNPGLGGTRRNSIVRRSADGTGTTETLLENEENLGPPLSVSPDGNYLVFRSAGGYDIRGLDLLKGGGSEPLLADPQFSETNGEVSPDGRWLAYQSSETGINEVYVRPFPAVDQGRWQISFGGGTRPAWSRSGRELFYQSSTDDGTGGSMPNRMMLVQVPAIAKGAAFENGKSREMFDLSPYNTNPGAGRAFDVAIDGRFVMVKPAKDPATVAHRPSIIVVTNWFEELKKKVPIP